jgi:hypothetical protein
VLPADLPDRLLEVDAVEQAGPGALPRVLHVGAVEHEGEGERHQQVPLPPGGGPVAGQGDGDHGLGEQGEGGEDGDQDQRRPAPVQPEVAGRGHGVQGDPGDGHDGQRAPGGLLGQGAVQRWQPEQRHHRPDGQHREQPAPKQGLVAQDGVGALPGQVERGQGGEHRRQQQAHRGGDGEPGVAPGEQHPAWPGRSSREPGAGQNTSEIRNRRASARRRATSLDARTPSATLTAATATTSPKRCRGAPG